MPPSMPLLKIRNLSFTYDRSSSPTLSDVNLDVREGELVLLCGPTGCGKTTLALSLNGLVPMTTGGKLSGQIQVCGLDPSQTPTPQMATQVGLVFQDPEGQLCTLFLEDEVAFGPENLCLPHGELTERVSQMLGMIGLQQRRMDSVFELSGGQKQKLNIVSVLAMKPRLLVLDMPTANLDPVGSADVFDLIRSLVSAGDVTCMVIENRLDDLVPLADRVVILDASGRVAYDASPEEVFAHGKDIIERLGVEIPQLAELALALQERFPHVSSNSRVALTVSEAADWLEALVSSGRLRVRGGPARDVPPRSSPAHPIVSAEDVHFAYRRGEEVLKGISFAMERGELLAIVGNNGSGKTTLAKQLVGLLRPAKGRIEVCGLDIRHARLEDVAAKAAYVFQYPEHQFVAQGQTVYDEIAFNLRMAGMAEPDVAARVEVLIERFGLTSKERSSPYELSGGEMRTLSVACMLSTSPELLVLDEPTYGQDRQRITALMQRLRELRSEGTSAIMITHDMRLVAEYATSVLLLNDGQILFHGPPAGLFARPDLLQRASLREPPICAVVQRLRERGIGLPPHVATIPDLLDALA